MNKPKYKTYNYLHIQLAKKLKKLKPKNYYV